MFIFPRKCTLCTRVFNLCVFPFVAFLTQYKLEVGFFPELFDIYIVVNLISNVSLENKNHSLCSIKKYIGAVLYQ